MFERSVIVESASKTPLIKNAVLGIELIKRRTLVIDYDQPVNSIALPKTIRQVSSDVEKVKILRSGMAEVTIVLLRKPQNLIHFELKELMSEASIEQAGLHETINFSSLFLEELVYDSELRIIALREEMRQGGVEFIPTILCNISGHSRKKWYEISTLMRDDLSFQNTYILGIEKTVPIR